MGNALEFILRLTDQLSPAMRSAANIADGAAARVAAGIDRITGQNRQMSSSLTELRTRLDQVNNIRINTRIADQFASATREARGLERQIARMENTGRSGGGLGGMIGGMVGGLGLTAGIGAALKKSADVEMTKINFNTLLGDKGKGAALYQDLNKFGNDTVFDNASVYKNAQTLLAFGQSGDKVIGTLKMLGDVSLGDQERMNSLTLAFAQVGSAGKLSGQDLLQFVNAGFNPLNEISKATGIKMGELKKQMENGAISSDMVTQAFQRATGQGGLFYNALANGTNTVSGKLGIFMGNLQTRLVALGDYLQPLTKWVLDFGSALLNNTPALLTIIGVVGVLTLAVKGVAWATQLWSWAQGIFNAVMAANPIVSVIGAIILLASWIVYAYEKIGWFRGAIQGAWEGLKSFGSLIKDFVVDMIKGLVSGITGIGQALMYFFKGDWSKAWEVGKQATTDLVGLGAINHAIENGKQIGAAVKAGYNNGVSQIAAKDAAAAKGAGVNPLSLSTGGAPGIDAFKTLGKDGASNKGKADSINSGGSRPIVINIAKQIEGGVTMHVMNAKEGVDEMGKMIREELVRVFYSLNGMTNS